MKTFKISIKTESTTIKKYTDYNVLIFTNKNYCDFWITNKWTPGKLNFETNYLFSDRKYV